MNKMKVMIIAVLVLVVGSLHAQSRIDENKLTDISYVSQICDVRVAFQAEHGIGYTLDNGMGFYNATINGRVMCIVVKNGEAYGRSDDYWWQKFVNPFCATEFYYNGNDYVYQSCH